jgi:hypothetical protein
MLKVQIPHEAGNRGVQEGTLPKTLAGFMEEFTPESAYFFAENGVRTALFVFDLKKESDLPYVAERFFMGFNAGVTAWPVMNADDLKAGIDKVEKSLKKR